MAHVGGAKSKGLPQTLTLDHVSPATRLLEKRRQMFEVQEALNAQKEDFQRREEAFRRREEGLRQKDLELQESLIKFNKFLQENESKRNRAEKRARDEGRQTVEKGKEIYKKSTEYEQMQLECAKVKEKLRKMSRYRDFLELAQRENAEDYPEISDLESRYKTLVSSNHELIEGQRENERKNEDQRTEFSDYTKTETNKMLNSNNLIANLQQRLESEEAAAAAAQDDFDESIRKTGDETLEVGQVVMAVQNLLLRCTKNHGAIKHYDDSKNSGGGMHTQDAHTAEDEMLMKGEQTAAELDVIAAYITDFSAIVDQFNTMHKKAEQKMKKDDEPAEDS
eukprot:Stramenopile-MAST_4_protein_2786